mmetsp:Transcript_72074/g.192624  ORF Transcript_72074/g.192624 Transcript_72074/m.192624 type:complete len:318 (+) Transcript_72074:45-998(+)
MYISRVGRRRRHAHARGEAVQDKLRAPGLRGLLGFLDELRPSLALHVDVLLRRARGEVDDLVDLVAGVAVSAGVKVAGLDRGLQQDREGDLDVVLAHHPHQPLGPRRRRRLQVVVPLELRQRLLLGPEAVDDVGEQLHDEGRRPLQPGPRVVHAAQDAEAARAPRPRLPRGASGPAVGVQPAHELADLHADLRRPAVEVEDIGARDLHDVLPLAPAVALVARHLAREDLGHERVEGLRGHGVQLVLAESHVQEAQVLVPVADLLLARLVGLAGLDEGEDVLAALAENLHLGHVQARQVLDRLPGGERPPRPSGRRCC